MFSDLFPPRYRYSRETPELAHALSADEVVAHLREHLFFEAHNRRYFQAKSERLAAEVARLSAAREAAGVDPGAAPVLAPAAVPSAS